jgi:hypothetical protein
MGGLGRSWASDARGSMSVNVWFKCLSLLADNLSHTALLKGWCDFWRKEIMHELDKYCTSCGEGSPKNECPNSKRSCGHHCNHAWTHDQCCWCGKEFGEEE